MRCLVTGASGFLGARLVGRLLAHGHSVSILLRPTTSPWRLKDSLSHVRVIEGSLEDLGGLREGLQKQPVDITFHLAWSGVRGIDRNNAELSIRNINGSLQLWKILHESGCLCMIGAGSQAEYGPYSSAISENMTTRPVTAYGASKLAIGILLKQLCFSSKMHFSWIRVFSLYGPGDDEMNMVPSLIHSLLRGTCPKLTLGEQVWDYLHVDDAAEAFCAVAENNAEGVFNLGSGCPVLLRDFVETVRNTINPELPLGFGEVPYRPDQVMHLLANIDLIQAATGWYPQISMQHGIQQTVEWSKIRKDEF